MTVSVSGREGGGGRRGEGGRAERGEEEEEEEEGGSGTLQVQSAALSMPGLLMEFSGHALGSPPTDGQ